MCIATCIATCSHVYPKTPISRDFRQKAEWFVQEMKSDLRIWQFRRSSKSTRYVSLGTRIFVRFDDFDDQALSWPTKTDAAPTFMTFFGLKKKKVPTPWIPYTFFDSFSKIVKNYIRISRGRYLFLFRTKKNHECRGHVVFSQRFFINFIVQSLDLSILDHFLTIFYTVLLPIPLHSLYSVVGLAKIHLQGWR